MSTPTPVSYPPTLPARPLWKRLLRGTLIRLGVWIGAIAVLFVVLVIGAYFVDRSENTPSAESSHVSSANTVDSNDASDSSASQNSSPADVPAFIVTAGAAVCPTMTAARIMGMYSRASSENPALYAYQLQQQGCLTAPENLSVAQGTVTQDFGDVTGFVAINGTWLYVPDSEIRKN